MADPVSAGVSAVSMASSIAGGIMGAKGAQAQAQGQAQMYMYQAGLSRLNRKIAEYNERETMRATEIAAVQLGLKQGQQMGRIRAGQAASGLDINSGSLAAVRQSQQETFQFDQGLLRYEGAKKAYGYKIEALGHNLQKKMYEAAAENALVAGKYAASASILGSVGSVSSKWLQGRSMGIF